MIHVSLLGSGAYRPSLACYLNRLCRKPHITNVPKYILGIYPIYKRVVNTRACMNTHYAIAINYRELD